MPSSSEKKRILICGGGNGAHCLAGLACSRANIEVNILSLFKDEAERWSQLVEKSKMQVLVSNKNGSQETLEAKPRFITKDTKNAMEGVHIIFIVVPAFAHSQYLKAIEPYLQPNTVIVGLPGQAGFEFQCKSILRDKAKTCTIASFESLPWACRIIEFGKSAHIMGFKESLGLSFVVGKNCNLTKASIVEILSGILGEKPEIQVVQNHIAINLMAKSMVHPPMMFGKWGDFDGKPLEKEPLFYQGIDEKQAELLSTVSDELIATGKQLEKKRDGVDMKQLIHIFDWYKTYYEDQISNKSSLMMAMRTNEAYNGLVHPMIKSNGGYVPNFNHRYLAEDIPFGLVVMKGIAEIAGVETPVMDKIIQWGQAKLGKEYIVGSKLAGRDLPSARAPQSFGLKTIEDIFDI